MHNFALWALSSLPSGEWKILQFDNSTALGEVEHALIGKFLASPDVGAPDIHREKTFLFDCQEPIVGDILIANLIFLVLMFEGHAYVTSSESRNGERLAIQDGFVDFLSRGNFDGWQRSIENFERDPMRRPSSFQGLE